MHIYTGLSGCYVSTGGAGAVAHWWCQLPNWVWKEIGEGPGHQDPLPHPSLQKVNTSVGNPGIGQALQPLVFKLLVLQDIYGVYSTVLTCTRSLNTINSLEELSCIIGRWFITLLVLNLCVNKQNITWSLMLHTFSHQFQWSVSQEHM